MKVLKMYGNAINERFIDEATDAMRRGQIIIYPTDTLYAIGCDALNIKAIEAICRLKQIDPHKQHLSITCCDLSQAARYAVISNRAYDILRCNLPGPFTFILPAAPALPKPFKGRRKVGVRVPDDPIARRLAEALGNPLLTTTIDTDGIVDQESDETVNMEIALRYDDRAALMLDAGPRGIVPSAIIDLSDDTDPQILRHGPVTPAQIDL